MTPHQFVGGMQLGQLHPEVAGMADLQPDVVGFFLGPHSGVLVAVGAVDEAFFGFAEIFSANAEELRVYVRKDPI